MKESPEIIGRTLDYAALFKWIPGLFVVLDPEEHRVLAVSDAYLEATGAAREHMLGKRFYDVFPDDPNNPKATGTRNLIASLERVKSRRQRDVMALQRHPIPDPETGELVDRYWSPVNSPVLNEQGNLLYIVHRSEDVTDYIRHSREAGEIRAEQPLRDDEAEVVRHSQELKLLAEEVRAGRERLQAIFDESPVGIAVTDLDGRFLEANPAYCRMLEYSLEELRELDFITITHPDDRARNEEARQALLHGATTLSFEKRNFTKSGKVIWCRVSGSVLRNNEGRPESLIRLMENITSQKEAEEQLRQSEALARIGGKIARVGGFAVDHDENHHVYWSREMYEILAWEGDKPPSLEAVVQQIKPCHRKRFTQAAERCAQEGKSFDMELELVSFKGEPLWIRVAARAEYDKQGNIVRTIGALQDITRQKAGQEERRQLSARLFATLETMRDAFYLLDEHWRFLYLNSEAERILKVDREELVGKVLWEAYPHLLDSPVYQGYHQAMTQHVPYHEEYFSEYLQEWVSVYAYPSSEGLAAYFHVTTEEKRLRAEIAATEERLHQSQRLESLGQLTGGVAHDFNNLLTVILGNVELLEEKLEQNPPLKELAAVIGSAAQRGADLTQRLLAFGRRQTLTPRAVQVNDLIREMEGLLRRSLGRHLYIDLALHDSIKSCLVDPNQLETALLNLCINARDAMTEGGQLTISTGQSLLDEDYTRQYPDVQPGDYVEVAVKDTGTGMPQEIIDHVFEPFFTTKDKGKGTGLGLSTVFGFIKQSNGHINIESTPGAGTTVRMYLPVAEGCDKVTAHKGSTAAASGGSETILLVEDDALVRQFAYDQLTELGYNVLVAEGGPAALEILERHSDIALLFTDVVMPGMDGWELADRALAILPELKILYTSGYMEDDAPAHEWLEKRVDLLRKPYRRAVLSTKVREMLDKS